MRVPAGLVMRMSFPLAAFCVRGGGLFMSLRLASFCMTAGGFSLSCGSGWGVGCWAKVEMVSSKVVVRASACLDLVWMRVRLRRLIKTMVLPLWEAEAVRRRDAWRSGISSLGYVTLVAGKSCMGAYRDW